MSFWDDYLRNPPAEIRFPRHWNADPEDYHCVRWRGYEGGLEVDELWQFGSRGMRGKDKMRPLPDFTQFGGETLCGLEIDSGNKMYGPRWRRIEPHDYFYEPPDKDNLGEVLIDLYGVTCMVCGNMLMYGMSRIIEDLTFIRSTLVGDWVGEEYISREPVVHGKHVTFRKENQGIVSEGYHFRCEAAKDSINPQLVDDVNQRERITCPDCLANIAAERMS